MWPAPLAGWRPDSLVQGDPCLGKFGKQSVSENLSYEGVWEVSRPGFAKHCRCWVGCNLGT
jgi:hypothetical protein